MKKYVLFLVVIGIAQILVGCSTNSPVSNDEEKPSYEELEEQLEAITNERDSLKAELDALEEELESKQETATVQDGDVTVLVTDTKKKEALVIADGDNFSLAIGRKGLNAKLATRLTKYKIDIKTSEQAKEMGISIKSEE